MKESIEDLDKIPAIQNLNEFAQRLPPEHRSKLYETIESFLCIGAMHGAFAGLDSAYEITSEGDKQKLYMAYLSRKAEEHRV